MEFQSHKIIGASGRKQPINYRQTSNLANSLGSYKRIADGLKGVSQLDDRPFEASKLTSFHSTTHLNILKTVWLQIPQLEDEGSYPAIY